MTETEKIDRILDYLGNIHDHRFESKLEVVEGDDFYSAIIIALNTLGDELKYSIVSKKELEKSEQRNNESQRIAKIGNWELDLATKELVWSDEIFRIFEIDKSKFGATYEAFLEVIHPEDRGLVNRTYSDSVENKTTYQIEHRLMIGEKIKYVAESGKTFYAEDGVPLKSIGTVMDITEKKLLEEESLKRYKRLTQFLQVSIDAIITINSQGEILYFNKAAEKLFGYSVEEVLGENVKLIVPKEHQANHDRYISEHIRTGINKVIGIGRELEMERKDGSRFYGHLGLNKVGEGDSVEFTAIIRDVTLAYKTRKQLESINDVLSNKIKVSEGELDQTSMLMDLVLSNFPITVFVLGIDQRISFAKGNNVSNLSYLYLALGKEFIHALNLDNSTKKEVEEVLNQSGNARIKCIINGRYFEMIFNSMFDTQGKLLYRTIAVIDIDELEEARKKIAKALMEEKKFGKLKTEFITHASHQLRTPTTIIDSNVQLLKLLLENDQDENSTKGTKLKEVSSRITLAIADIRKLAEDLSVLGILYSGEGVHFEMVDVERICLELLKSINPQNPEKLLTVVGKPFLFGSNRGFLSKSLDIFIGNGQKFSKDNTTVEVLLEFTEKMVIIKIKDNGIGIPESELDQIFEPFYKGKDSIDTSGPGLSMDIAKKCLDVIKGTVSIQSNRETGTEVLVTIPVNGKINYKD